MICTLYCCFGCIVGMLCPIMNEESVLFIAIQPPRFQQRFDHFPWFSVPFDPSFNRRIGVLADIAAWGEPASEMPNRFQAA